MLAVVCKYETGVCSCDHRCNCSYLKPLFAVVLAVVPGLKSPFALAVAAVLAVVPGLKYPIMLPVVDDLISAVAVVLAVVPGLSFAVDLQLA